MSQSKPARHARAVNITVTAITLVLLVAVIWIDITSQVWQETVILSGVAAGLVTFLLTALFLDRAVARREHAKWYPVTRLALSDLLHTIADDQLSDVHRGRIVARSLSQPQRLSTRAMDELLHAVVLERDEITAVLSRWAPFLAASADVQALMIHIASLAESLDAIRDEIVEIESGAVQGSLKDLQAEVSRYNQATRDAIQEILSVQASLS